MVPDPNGFIQVSDQKREELKSRQKGLLWAYAILTLVSIGVFLYLKQIVLPRQEQEFSSFLIKIASKQVMNICREFSEIELQQKSLESAKELGDSDLIEAYRNQIEGRQERVKIQITDYQDIILKLGDFREKIVNIEFAVYAKALIKEKSFSLAHAARLVKSDYKLFTGNKDLVNVEMIHQACKKNLVKF
jgi:hypothetical protein